MRLQQKYAFFCKVVTLVALGCSSIASAEEEITGTSNSTRPNFIIFLVDDMGYMDLSCYGSTFYETPNIDKLASEGVKFTQAYAACPVCSPSRIAVLTGKYPARLNATDFFRANVKARARPQETLVEPIIKNYLPLEEVTLAEALKAHGYTTYIAGKWHLGEVNEYGPEKQGFDINKGATGSGHPKSYTSPYSNPKLPDGPEGEYLTDRLSSETATFIDEHAEKPFFVYFPFYNVHTPLQARPDLLKKYEEKRRRLGLDDKFSSEGAVAVRDNQSMPVYAAMVESVDQAVGNVLNSLEKNGIADNTVIIFTSDNGGLSTAHTMPTSNRPLRAGKGWMYEGGIREPLIIKWPGKVAAGSINNAVVAGTDFYPTVLEIAKLPLMPEQHLDGTSLVPILKDATTSQPQRDIFWHYPHYGNQGGKPSSAIRSNDWKLIKWYEDGRLELFNLASDPAEQRELSKQHPEKVAELSARLEDWLKSVDAKFPTPK